MLGPGPQDAIAEITKVVKIPVIANGGIESRHDPCAHRINYVEYLERGYCLELCLEILSIRENRERELHLSFPLCLTCLVFIDSCMFRSGLI